MKKHHDVRNLHFEGADMVVTIDGQEKRFDTRAISPALCAASEEEKYTFAISASGYGIHWPLLDEDLSIDGLLGIVHTPPKHLANTPSAS